MRKGFSAILFLFLAAGCSIKTAPVKRGNNAREGRFKNNEWMVRSSDKAVEITSYYNDEDTSDWGLAEGSLIMNIQIKTRSASINIDTGNYAKYIGEQLGSYVLPPIRFIEKITDDTYILVGLTQPTHGTGVWKNLWVLKIEDGNPRIGSSLVTCQDPLDCTGIDFTPNSRKDSLLIYLEINSNFNQRRVYQYKPNHEDKDVNYYVSCRLNGKEVEGKPVRRLENYKNYRENYDRYWRYSYNRDIVKSYPEPHFCSTWQLELELK